MTTYNTKVGINLSDKFQIGTRDYQELDKQALMVFIEKKLAKP